ncbi:disease resistance protein RUN1-like [Rutidosis leptorrhynchoides]|uniref:disease resistance protein RUN1-like n=1 Tax=Rutidosis leptorrhynchoides TaxID=125765 RepID=UPI003A98FE91
MARDIKTCVSSSRCAYHVFLSFRGADTRTNFTDHLYHALEREGVHTYRDDEEIVRGGAIKLELEKAINQSKVSVIVISENYASSSWCLDELVMIMEKRRTAKHIVLPVFYRVDPHDVRRQMGSFAKAFAELESENEKYKIEKWRAALKEVANLAGMNSNNRHEADFIHDIVKEVQKKLERLILNVPTYIVGRYSITVRINNWLNDGSKQAGIGIIYGIGGIGKTTLAKTVYNQNIERFDGGSFLADIRDAAKETSSLIRIQKQLLSDILKRPVEVQSVIGGIQKIRDVIHCRKVLVILDDVDEQKQLEQIFGSQHQLCPGSKIIITTRYKNMLSTLRSHEVSEFEVEGLGTKDSMKLFSWHAFGKDHPIEDLLECSKQIVDHCGGPPLALEVLGASLFDKTSVDVWENMLKKLKAIPNRKIQDVLRVSYDSLSDDDVQSIFLDIACFFVEEEYNDYMVEILDGCGHYSRIGIENLVERCMLNIHGGRLSMHNLIRDMGREIVRQESLHDLGKRSRIWNHNEAYALLKERSGTKRVIGITLDFSWLKADESGEHPLGKRRRIWNDMEESALLKERTSTKRMKGISTLVFSWLKADKSGEITRNVDADTFTGLQNVKLLKLNYGNLIGNHKNFPKNLIWLCWHGFPMKCIPPDFCLQKVVSLDVSYSKIKRLWEGAMSLPSLKFLYASHCHQLVTIPNFSGTPFLKSLIMEDCTKLVMLDAFVGRLERLEILNLNYCKNLKKLPWNINVLRSLQELHLSGCSALDLDGFGSNQFSSIYRISEGTLRPSLNTVRYTYSKIRSWMSPKTSPLGLFPSSLTHLTLQNCNLSDDDISLGLFTLCSLKHLDLSGNPFCSIPIDISNLTKLGRLVLDKCSRLKVIQKLPSSLKVLELRDCTSVEKILGCDEMHISKISSDLHQFLSSQFRNTVSLVEVEGRLKLDLIGNVDPQVIESLGLYRSESLEGMKVNLKSFGDGTYIYSTPFKVLYEFNICSIFLPVSKVPNCYNIHEGTTMSFVVPSKPGFKIRALNLCKFLYQVPSNLYTVRFEIFNETKRIRWQYWALYKGFNEDENGTIIWLSYWNIGDKHIDAGDHIRIYNYLDACTNRLSGWKLELAEKEEEKLLRDSHSSDV